MVNIFVPFECSDTSPYFPKVFSGWTCLHKPLTIICFLSFSLIFTIVSVFIGILLHFGYTHVPDDWTQKTLLRSFINAIFFDLILVILSPIILLYSSKELRKSLKAKCTKEWIFKWCRFSRIFLTAQINYFFIC